MLLRIENLHKSFKSIKVLDGINLDVTKNEVVVILGRSGSGKSTLLRCINGLEPIEDGAVIFEGNPVTRNFHQLRLLREQIGVVFQSFNLFPHLTALNNVALAPRIVKKMTREEANELARRQLDLVGLADKCESFPSELSGGQQQRVAIARGLAMNPILMMFDEITSALDPELIGEVLKVMEKLAESGMTMICVTHEMGFARRVADHVVFLHEGRIQEEGTPSEIFDHPRSQSLQQFIGAIL